MTTPSQGVPSRVAIVGPGLIGRSVALAAMRARPDVSVIEVDRGQPLSAIATAELIVLASPVDAIIEFLERDAAAFPSAVITDTGSTKRLIVAAAREAGLTRFVGGHPMAGAASSGPAGARADLFDRRPWFLVPAQADAAAVTTVQAFVQALGARPVVVDDDGREHDRVLAAVSHLPQAAASALMAVAGAAAGDRLEWAGKGLRDTVRLAASSGAMWESILASNADELAPLLLALADELRNLANNLQKRDHVREVFERANRFHAALAEQGDEG